MSYRYEVTMHLLPHDEMKTSLSGWSYSEIVKASHAGTAAEIFLESHQLKAAIRNLAGIKVPFQKSEINIKAVSLGPAAEADA